MKTAVDALLRAEVARFSLRFACEDCVHFDEPLARCSLGYPAAPRRCALDEPGEAHLETCKAFELGT